MKETTVIVMAIVEIIVFALLLSLAFMTLNEVKRDPYDVNNDGVANIVDLSVLAAEVNNRGK